MYDGVNWIAVENSANLFSSYGSRTHGRRMYILYIIFRNKNKWYKCSLKGGFATEAELEDLSQTVLDLSTNYYEFKNDFVDLSLTVEDLSENLLRRYEDASFGTAEIRDIIINRFSVTNLDVANRFLVAPNTDISAVIGRANRTSWYDNLWAGFKM